MLSESGVQLFVGDELLRGLGEPTEKSMLLLSESKQPPRLRRAAVVLLKLPVGPAPSKQLAVVPYPTRSTAHVGQEPLKAVVEVVRATLPAPAAMRIVPVASGVGSGLPTAAFDASW